MKRIQSWAAGFPAVLTALEERGGVDFSAVEERVREILEAVRLRGDAALIEFAARFDQAELTPQTLRVGLGEIRQAAGQVSPEVRALLAEAVERIRAFHEKQRQTSWFMSEEDGTLLGQNITAVESAGLYVPGGKAAYPSTVLMNAIPAQVAGVKRLVICTPAVGGEVNPLVLAAADLLGITEIYRIGGAHAVAAMAYGTASVPRVDKIVGPGNIWVAAAKRAVYGRVSIDMIAGPSEVFVIADGQADAAHIAADLLSQAEHDEMATTVLLTTSARLADAVEVQIELQLAALSRRKIAAKSLTERGYLIEVRDVDEAFALANRLGPEHLEVLVQDPLAMIPRARFVGSAFFGPHTPEALGDYLAGPNHVLPTGGSARFSSPLGVQDFLVRSNILFFPETGFRKLAEKVAAFADLEGLGAHAAAARIRLAKKKDPP